MYPTLVAVNEVPELGEKFAPHELPIETEFAVEIFADHPLTLELPLLVTVKLETKPPPQSFTLTEQPRLPPPVLPLDELELLLEELELDDELELLEELLDELELEELLVVLPVQFAADGLLPLTDK